jgi:photosystem II stability/assembly factor-like uncharacterized protein
MSHTNRLLLGVAFGFGLLFLAYTVFFKDLKKAEGKNSKLNYGRRLSMVGNPGVTFAALQVSADGKRIWLGGSMGTIRYSIDSGKTWQPSKMPLFTDSINDIHFLSDGNRGWAVGNRGLVLKSIDGGVSWQRERQIVANYALHSVTFSSDGNEGAVAGRGYELWVTHNGGLKWNRQTVWDGSTKMELFGVGIRPNKEYAVWGDKASLAVSQNRTFKDSSDFFIGHIVETTFPEEPYPTIRGAALSADNRHIVAIDDSGHVVLTRTGGAPWQHRLISRGKKFPLLGMWFEPQMQNGWIVTDEPAIFYTPNGGDNWQQQYADTAKDGRLYRVQFAEKLQLGWACGSLGILLHTKDGGRNWQSINPFESSGAYDKRFLTADFTNVYCINKNVVLAVGIRGAIMKSVDSGRHWNRVHGGYSQPTLMVITSVPGNESHLWAAGRKGVFLESNDAGEHWTSSLAAMAAAKNAKLTDTYCIAFFSDGEHGIAAGVSEKMIITADGGRTWQPQELPVHRSTIQQALLAPEGGQGVLVGNKGTILRSTDYGESWTRMPFPDSLQNISGAAFAPDLSYGYAATFDLPQRSGRHLYRKTTSEGLWKLVESIPENRQLTSIALNSNGMLTVVGDSGLLLSSQDGGQTWFKPQKRITDTYIQKLALNKDGELFAACYKGVVLGPGNKDANPVIDDFAIKPVGDKLTAYINAHDPDTPSERLQVGISVTGKFDDVVESTSALIRLAHLDNIKQLRPWSTAAFIYGNAYKFTLSVSDGTTITTQVFNYRHGNTLMQRVMEALFLSPMPKTGSGWLKAAAACTGIVSVLYALIVLILYVAAPWQYVKWHEAVASSQLPLPEYFSKFLALFLVTTHRSLDAFVRHYCQAADDAFARNPDTQSRPEWVPAPVKINGVVHMVFTDPNPDGKIVYIPGLTELRQRLGDGPVHDIIIIEGPGGVGKTSFALQIARWARKDNPVNRLYEHQALPLLLDNTTPNLDQAAIDHLRVVVNRPELSLTLARALLYTKRILVIVDGITEIPSFEGAQLDPTKNAAYTKAVVYTARRPLPAFLQNYNKLMVTPLGIDLASLDALLDNMISVIAGAGAFGEEREILRSKIKSMMRSLQRDESQKPLPLTFVRLMIIQADALRQVGRMLSELPDTLVTLLDTYLEEVFREEISPTAIISALREAALVSLNAVDSLTNPLEAVPDKLFRPQRHPDAAFTARPIVAAMLPSLLSSGVLVADGPFGNQSIKFSHDPVAEFCLARELVLRCRLGQLTLIAYEHFAEIAEKQNPNVFLFLRELRQEITPNTSLLHEQHESS